MQVDLFDYSLPEELVAQVPLAKRDDSRLLVVRRSDGSITHTKFSAIGEFLRAGDLMVFNESKVIPARLLGKRTTGGKVEVFVLRPLPDDQFECLVRATTSQKAGMEFEIDSTLKGRVIEQIPGSISFKVKFSYEGNIWDILDRKGQVPLPPYIQREADESDKSRYQTLYAKTRGSVAAPTAGLHYTEELLNGLKAKGVGLAFVHLHVGLGTFQPLKTQSIEEHKMHVEEFVVPEETLRLVKETKARGGRVIAVGTTSARSLESAARGKIGTTDLYLYPGEEFMFVDVMQTNFHQPRSSLLVMMGAFMGMDLWKKTYEEALKERYRFLSYGDSMLVL